MKLTFGNYVVYMSATQIHDGTIRNTYTDYSGLEHYKFRITCKYEGQKFSFVLHDSYANWQQNKTKLDKNDLKDALNMVFTDAMSYEDNELDGLSNRQKNGCKREYEKVKSMFGCDWYKVAEALNESY